ncbi:MAG TPA: YHS domain-containing protein [Nitrospirota bacterium]|jgi:YHS domain-containing protein
MKKDIVCGMDVSETTDFTTLHGGKKMYFCSKECQQNFLKNPEEYIAKAEKGGKAA